MATVLIVDDSPVDRLMAGSLLEKTTGLKAVYAENGRQALAAMQAELPALVLTDMQMPEMDGFELVRQVRHKFPTVPVILMTAHGSEELAVQALQRGATSYVPKRNLARDLAETVDNVLAVSGGDHQQLRLRESLMSIESHFRLDNDPSLVPSLISHLEENATRMRLCDATGLIRVGVALHEALTNAIQHGNLEMQSSLRQKDEKAYQATIHERRVQPPYMERRVYVTAKVSRSHATYTIRDEGPGFDPYTLPDPTDPTNLEKVSGRGLLLIRTFMDEVSYNETGNQITMVKRREEPGGEIAAED